MIPENLHILLVEDHHADIALTKRAFKQSDVPHTLDVVLDGVEALQYLKQEGTFSTVRKPDLILLDLKMPRLGGWEVLKEIKADTNLRHIPVIVLTTSNDERDVKISYNLHANSYIVKPVDYQKFKEALEAVGKFWFETVRLQGHD